MKSYNGNLGTNYTGHEVFIRLNEFKKFYDSLSFSTMGFSTMGTKALVNLDTYVFSSIAGTLESINEILLKGRVNDAYALLRKHFDSTMINIYTNLYLDDHFSIENFVVQHIDDWRSGKKSIPEYRVISRYIKESDKLKVITDLLKKDSLYKEIRERCNDHTHYNFYHNLLLNDNEIHSDRIEALDTFSADLTAVFIQHFAYLFYLKDHYMMSSDYVDYLDLGMTPPEDSQYWVASFIQETFDKWVKPNRPDIADEIINHTCMKLQ